MGLHFGAGFSHTVDNDFNANSPLVAYDNAVTTSNIAATTADASYPVSNLANPATHLLWKGTSTGADEYVTVTLSGSQDVDYIAVARHNFGTRGAAVTVQTDTGGVWSSAVTFTPTDDSPIVACFAKGSYDGVRLKLAAASPVPYAAVVYCGAMLRLQRRVQVGHTPLTLATRNKVEVGRAERGHFLGRVIVGQHNATKVNIRNMTEAWYRANMVPLLEAAEGAPFFFAWRPSTYPLEVGYAWLKSDAIPDNVAPNGLMDVELDLSGIVS